AALDGGEDGLGAVGDAELGEDVAQVDLHGALDEAEVGGDLLVAAAARDEAEDLELARRELGDDAPAQPGVDLRRDVLLARVYAADALEHAFERHLLDHEAHRAGLEGLEDLVAAGVVAED